MNDILQTILERAEHRHEERGDSSEFLAILAQQATDELRLSALTLWAQTAESFNVVVSTDATPDMHPDDEPSTAPGTGRVAVLPDSTLDGNDSGRRLQTSVSVARAVRLILRATEGTVPVNHDLLLQLTDIFADLHRRNMLDNFVTRSQTEDAWQTLIAHLHGSLDNRVIANTIATDAAPLLTASRIGVGRREGRHWKIVATSGVSQPNERSDAIRQLISTIQSTAMKTTETATDDGCRIAHPLHPDQSWSETEWAIVLESDTKITIDGPMRRFFQHAALALTNSTASQRKTPARLLRSGLRTFTQPSSLSALVGVCALAFALVFLETELRIEAYGELVPTQRNYMFAPEDGIITELNVEDGSPVLETDILCTLTNEELNVQQETIAGELAETNARLTAIDALRTGNRAEAAETRLLSAEQAELDERVRSLEKQWTILSERIALLEITSRIPGNVYGDRLRQLLYQRPVARGQYLFEIANPAGGWQLELRVPESDVRYVLTASQQTEQQPDVTFSLKTSPEVVRETWLLSLGASTDVDTNGELSTLAIATVNGDELNSERPGTGVVARIHCGKRSIGFVWFRQVIEFVQRHTWL